MKEVKIPVKLKPYFERKIREALFMVDHYYLNGHERIKWERWACHWKKKLNKLNKQQSL